MSGTLSKTSNKGDEDELIERIQQGESSLFRVLVVRYKDISLSVASSIIKNQKDAEDIVQDAFLRAYLKLDSFNFDSAFSTWFYRIVVNTALNAKEKKKRTLNKESKAVSSLKIEKPLQGRKMQLEDQRYYINLVLDRMKPKEAMVLRLYYLGEQDTKSIAGIMDLSISNVKVILYRARKKFNDLLDKTLGKDKYDLL